jgi:hypothetical protein
MTRSNVNFGLVLIIFGSRFEVFGGTGEIFEGDGDVLWIFVSPRMTGGQ